MDKQLIKQQLLDYSRQFKQMMGSFGSFETVYDYINFITSEKYLAEKLLPIAENLSQEEEKFDNLNLDLKDFVIDMSNPNALGKMPFFKKEYGSWQEDLNNKKELRIMTGVPIFFALLSDVAFLIQCIKDFQEAGDLETAKKLIEEVKEKSLSIVDTSMIIGIPPKRMTYGQYIDVSMELVNKFLIDEIDSESLLENAKPEKPLHYDSEKSLLYIRGQIIEIVLKNEKPVDHYVLEAIFSSGDFNEQISFMEIAEDFRETDYDGEKDWQTYRHACDNLNKKIGKQTDNKIPDFIKYTTGKTGWCKINPKYL